MAAPDALEARLSGLIAQLAPAERRALTRALARQLRQSNARRVAAQQNPDGSPFAPRKSRLDSIKDGRLRALIRAKNKGSIRQKMFARLMKARYLKIEAGPNAAALVFTPSASYVARIHQFGLRARVERRGPSPEVKYPERELLGFTADDRDEIAEMILKHLAG